MYTDRNCFTVYAIYRRMEAALFKALIQQPITMTVPDKKFYSVSAPVYKGKHAIPHRILSQFIDYDTAQTVKAFSHVRRVSVQPNLLGIRDAKHGVYKPDETIRTKSSLLKSPFMIMRLHIRLFPVAHKSTGRNEPVEGSFFSWAQLILYFLR